MTNLTGKTAVIFSANKSTLDGVESALSQAGAQVIYTQLDAQITEFGVADIAVIVCGADFRKPFLETSAEEWDGLLAYYFEQPLWASQAFARNLIQQNRPGSIIFLSSIAGKMPFVGMSVMGTALGALRALAKMAAVDLGPHGITVNVIERGWMDGSAVLMAHAARPLIEAGTPTGKIVEMREIGDLCCFLASDAARSITGQILTVDGGYTLTPGS